jgi:hypothetical protein
MMIEVELFTYSDEQWDQIRIVVRDALGLDADQIERPITRLGVITGMQSLRDRIEFAVNYYQLYSAGIGQRLPRAELIAIRNDAANLRDRIIDALGVQFVNKRSGRVSELPMLRPGARHDMPAATRDYFTKLALSFDDMIEWAEIQRGDNARKIARDGCWNELLAIWCELGGKATGKATASFLIVASKPVMGSAVPDIASVMRWLERRQNKTANKVTKPVRRATR